MKVILLFPSIHYVLKAEKILKKEGVNLDLVPVPKEISSDCGMALEIKKDDLPLALKTLASKNLKPSSCQEKTPQGYQEVIL
ncbi:hypothetical protein Thein_1086 [Thermodesulfatator indicus DSM 15286]|uniref:Putative Se/S carrier protein-like domain-containing protein n=1 Tax=Thermodesulfatator indicus (strain DSM 15286 / JCM 11887 / CIR29812) TaxID=667014 RepID=F8ADZ2_THEID|nr:DUF3343 domain-containing protein [Thermodesulfatator indicus]AEH44957.1 hypothetical protein Thein_1086 [Thermodesulfatator indicus DSM 15286]